MIAPRRFLQAFIFLSVAVLAIAQDDIQEEPPAGEDPVDTGVDVDDVGEDSYKSVKGTAKKAWQNFKPSLAHWSNKRCVENSDAVGILARLSQHERVTAVGQRDGHRLLGTLQVNRRNRRTCGTDDVEIFRFIYIPAVAGVCLARECAACGLQRLLERRLCGRIRRYIRGGFGVTTSAEPTKLHVVVC